MSSSSFYSDSGITTADADAVESSKNAAAQSAQDAQTHANTASTKASEASDSAIDAAASASTANNSNVQAVAANLGGTNTIGTVAGNIADINTVAGMESDVDTVANSSYKAKVETVANAAYKSDVETVADSSYKSDVETVADSTYKAKVETVANSTYKTKVEEVAADLSGSNTIGAAVQSASDAATSASNASTSETNAASSESTAATHASNASTHATTASGHADDAEDAKTAAQAARDAAQGHRTQTGQDATAAAASANSASSSASAAATSESNAASSEQNAQGYSTAAAGSASTANTNALVAISEASDAADSASTASTASASAVAANTAAQVAKDDSEDAKDAAELAKTAAETAQTNASNYASTASTSASTATTKASEASSSAAAANTSATNAAVSYTNAFNAATDSVNAASAWSSFYTTYLGSYSSAPSVDVQGNPIVTGAFYYDTGAGSNTVGLYVYNGSSWVYSTNYNNVTAPYSLAQDLATNSHDISFGDNAKANFGASDDLQIYHNGSDSYIRDVGTGNLNIDATNFNLRTGGGNEIYLSATTNGAVGLRYDNAEKLATTATGINVTGDITLSGNVFTDEGFYGNRVWNEDNSDLRFATNNTEKMRITSTGNVGIGTTSPAKKLTVYEGTSSTASSLFHNNLGTVELRLAPSAYPNDIGSTARWSAIQAINGGSGNPTSLAFLTNGVSADPTERMRITADGNVGIGTTSPRNQLTVGNTTDSADDQNATVGIKCDANHQGIMLQENSGAEQWSLGVNADGDLNFYDSQVTTPTVTFKDNGGVGIGTTSPDGKLHVYTSDSGATVNSNADDLVIESATNAGISILGDGNETQYLMFGDAANSAVGRVLYDHNTNHMGLWTNSNERMRIDSSGNVGIGTSSPDSKVTVDGNLSFPEMSFKASNQTSRKLTIGMTDSTDHYISAVGSETKLLFKTQDTERMRIDSSGNLLVGTTQNDVGYTDSGAGFAVSPLGFAQVARSSASSLLYLNKLDNDGSIIGFYKDGLTVGSIGITSSELGVGGGDANLLFMPNDNAIAPSSTSSGGASDGVLDLGRSARRFKDLYLSNKVTNPSGALSVETSGGNQLLLKGSSELVFHTNSSERSRIDSSGNLLVGTTTSTVGFNNAIEGVNLRSEGRIFASADQDYPLNLSRNTNDGDIAVFRKDGVPVGSIGIQSSGFYIDGEASHLGLRFGSGAVVPRLNGSDSDNTADLGESGLRFKDLYLSGGVHLGGTGTANKLDDYEEGTWTPTLIGSTGGSATMTVARNNYTKVGNMCTAYMYVNAVDTTGSFSGDVRIGGLPFAAGNNFEQAVTVTYCNLFNFDEADRTVSGYVSGTQIWLHNGSSNATISTSNLNSASNGVTMLAVTYRTA